MEAHSFGMNSSHPQQSPFLFDAIDSLGERVQGTVQGKDEDEVRVRLQREFGYKVVDIREKLGREQVVPVQKSPIPQEERKKEEPILFEGKPKEEVVGKKISEETLRALHHRVDVMMKNNASFLSESTQAQLRHLNGKIDLLKNYASWSQFLRLRWQLWRALRRGEREISLFHQKKWQEYEGKAPENPSMSYTEFGDSVKKQRIFHQPQQFFSRLKHWRAVLEHPDETKEKEVLAKQQYESVWLELQRFSTALMAFYLIFLCTAYYLKRNLGSDLFVVRIYDAPLFKQIMLALFCFSGLVTLRRFFIAKRITLDASLLLSFMLILWLVF